MSMLPQSRPFALFLFLFAGLLSLVSFVPAETIATTATLRIDFESDHGPIAHNASGILHSIQANEPPDHWVCPLQLRNFRGRPNNTYLFSEGLYDRLVGFGIRHIQVVISDNYGYPNWFYGWPGDNESWAAWENIVDEAVGRCQDAGMAVEYDIWNEPDIGYFWGRDRARWFETWRRGFLRIRALDSNAVIIGPSIASFNLEFIADFLHYARANNCIPDILSWHELSSPGGRQIPGHVASMREWLNENDFSIQRISINEIIPNNHQFSPGTAVSYFVGLEKTDVESAMHSCWEDIGVNNGENASLDGMLTHDTKMPRSSWWAYYAYARLRGNRLQTVTLGDGDPRIDGLAVYDSDRVEFALLVANFQSDRSHPIHIELQNLSDAKGLLDDSGFLTLSVALIRNTGTNPLPQPEIILRSELHPTAPDLEMDLPPLPSNSVYTLRLRSGLLDAEVWQDY